MEVVQISSNAFKKLCSENGKGFYWATNINDELPIKSATVPEADIAPMKLTQIVRQNAKVARNKPALSVKREKQWISWTWEQTLVEAVQFAKSLIALNIPERSCVNIIGFNSPEWVIAYYGTIFANCVPVGIYTTNQSEACKYVAEHSEAQILVAQNEEHIRKYRPFLQQFKAVIVYEASKKALRIQGPIFSWKHFLTIGQELSDQLLDERERNIAPGSCMTIIYTSGTTGNPKGVMLTHDNLIWLANNLISHIMANTGEKITDDERILSFLPLSHIAAQLFDIVTPLIARCQVLFANESALKGGLAEFLQEVEPTVFLAVPRVWEKMLEKIAGALAKESGLKKQIINWSRSKTAEAMKAYTRLEKQPFGYLLANTLLVKKIKQQLGFTQCKAFFVGAAPMPLAHFQFFMSLGIPIMNAYGMSESSGAITVNCLKNFKLGSAGLQVPGSEIRILNQDGQPLPANQKGEICWRGRLNFMGYFKDEESTANTIDKNGFLHSGDEGYLDEDGVLYITGRFKELIITAGGENVAPVLIENKIKEKCPILSQVFVIGDDKKFLTAFLTLKVNVNMEDLSPTFELTPEAQEFIQRHLKVKITTVQEALKSKEIKLYLDNVVDGYNQNDSISRAQRIQKWSFLERDFSIPGGEMTPTLKVKRKIVQEKYHDKIQQMYQEAKI